MSYLTLNLDQAQDKDMMTKVVISFWFRVPADTIRAAFNAGQSYPVGYNWQNYKYIIPLLTFGPQITRNYVIMSDGEKEVGSANSLIVVYEGTVDWDPDHSTVVNIISTTLPIVAPYPQSLGQLPVETSWIGLYADTAETASLALNIQTLTVPDITNFNVVPASVVGRFGDINMFFTVTAENIPTSVPWVSNIGVTTYEDVTSIMQGNQPDFYGNIGGSNIDVKPDTWHHVLISWDIAEGVATHGSPDSDIDNIAPNVSASSKLWVAFDDVNYDKDDLPARWVTGGDPNEIITSKAREIASSGPPPPDDDYNIYNGGTPTYTMKSPKVECSPICIPSGNNYEVGKGASVTTPYNVAMAELLIFTGVTLDTSIEGNRRLFITKPDNKEFQHPKNGSPLTLPYRKFAIGDPFYWEDGADNPAFAPPLFDPSATPSAVKFSEKAEIAQVDFTKCAFNWMMGRNTGKAKGRVEKTGKIKAYWPPDGSDPALKASSGGG